jgi:hypothetical protein
MLLAGTFDLAKVTPTFTAFASSDAVWFFFTLIIYDNWLYRIVWAKRCRILPRFQ